MATIGCAKRLWEATIRINPGTRNEADLMTKFFDGKKIQDIVQNIGFHHARSQLALTAALDGLTRVDSDSQRAENTRTDARHEKTFQAAQIQKSGAS